MIFMMHRVSLFLLQTNDGVKYFKDDDPLAGIILLIGIGVAIVLALVVGFIRYGLAKAGITFFRSRSVKRFSPLALRRAVQQYRLSGEQVRLLSSIFQNNDVSDPQRVLENAPTLDRHFKSTYRVLKRGVGSKNDAEVQQQLAQLFSTRIAIESSPFGISSGSIPKITERSAAVLKAGGKNYSVTVLNSHERQMTIDCPVNALGTPVSLPKGSRVALSCFIDATRGFASAAEMVQMVRDAKGTPVLDLVLKGKPETLVKRKSRRRQITIPCEMQVVTVKKSGNRTMLTPDARKYPGDIQDISTGGCSIRTRGLLKPGSRIKIVFEHRDGAVSVLGQILRINRGALINTIIHVKFTKIPLKAMNVINATVFEYNEV
jgi:c-di-GMP-binding flagellar brake protein YcgR